MIHISILALKSAVLASVSDSRYIFTTVNDLLKQSGRPALFDVRLVGLSKEVKISNGLFSIAPDVIMEDVHKTDLIIIPAMTGDMMSSTYQNKDFAPWIAQQYKEGAAVASLCVGAFLFAFSGLLRGKQCTTHWQYANDFRSYYPDIQLVDEKMITEQDGLYSSGGSNSYWNLLLYLVEKYTDREMAIYASKYFVIDISRNDQSPFAMFSGPKDHEDDVVRSAQEYIEQNYRKKITVDWLAEKFNMGRRTFERRFKKATYLTVVEYIQRVKIEAAKKQLETGRKTVHEIMDSVGYTDDKTFRDVFRKITGMTPVDYRDKYKS